MTHTGEVLIAAPVHPVLTDGLLKMGYTLRLAPDIHAAQAAEMVAGCVGVITSTRIFLSRELLKTNPQLQWIGRMGSGMEVIAVEAAREQGIYVFASPEGNRNAVAEHALGMLLSLLKKIPAAVREVMQGMWLREENRGEELEGKTVGIIGFGHTGRAFAQLLSGFKVTVLAYDPYTKAPFPEKVQPVSLEELQSRASVISFHVPIRPETRHYFDEKFLENLAQPVVLINTARGEVVKSAVLEAGLESGKIKAAALDVWEGEPIQKMKPEETERLLRLSRRGNVLITPHIAGYSFEALFKMSDTLLQKLQQRMGGS